MKPSLRRGVVLVGVLAILSATLLLLVTQYYVAVLHPGLDWKAFAVGVALPAIGGSAILLAAKSRVVLFTFLAYLWSVTDDAPVNLDSVYTWPAVTSGLQHTVAEVILHLLTLAFMYLAVKEAFRGSGRETSLRKLSRVLVLVIAAFVLASVSIVPLPGLRAAISSGWYQIDVVGHLMSLAFLSVALREAARRRGSAV